MAPIQETTEEARQGENKGWITRVLVVSTTLAIGLMIGSYVFAV